MTTIDHQQAAVEAGARMLNPDAWEAYDRSDKTHWERGMVRRSLEESDEILTAAAPHLRAAFLDELKRAQFEVEGRHPFGFGENGVQCLCGFASPRNRSRTEHITRAVLALLEGSGEIETHGA